ncbi:hypothetical protein QBC42DRAFT_331475 [Cladorrhinum samala]|uniref:Uncharacterized protein n=1 Tax=Cladorrhinum samala TaxID=585594 RepID=A0AAV9HK77_9PEZI|nr:hypothetical protein QBC42DRAFT_331475 [Cladorrhinum samala]
MDMSASSLLSRIKSTLEVTLGDTIFDHDECRNRIQGLLDNGIVSAQSSPLLDFIFVRDKATGKRLMGYNEMTITYPACEALCGKRGWYVDRGPRVMVWVLPILLLLSNVELSPIDKRRFVSIVQSGGDPIDCIWSLLAKLDSRKRMYRMVRGHVINELHRRGDLHGLPWEGIRDKTLIITTVLSGLEDIFSPELAACTNPHDAYYEFMTTFGAFSSDPRIKKRWSQAALELVDSRTDERLRALLALALYILGLCSAFIADIGGTTQTAPGGVIGASLSLSFLIPIVILSNTVGAYTSRRTALGIMTRFVDSVPPGPQQPVQGPLQNEPWSAYFNRLHWSGAVDTFRPWKTRSHHRAQTIILGAISSLPITAGYGGAMGIMFNAAEQGLSCRHMFLTAMYSLWWLSVAVSNTSYNFNIFSSTKTRRAVHWFLCLAKDVCIAIPSLTFIFLSAAGWFNSCNCWSRRPILGEERASVYLPVNDIYKRNNGGAFPGIVGGVVVFHFLFCGAMLWWFREGVSVLRWSEKRKQRVWEEVMGAEGLRRERFLPDLDN